MTPLIDLGQFKTILDFAFAISHRGIPLSLVMVEPDGWSDGASAPGTPESLEGFVAEMVNRTRRSDRLACVAGARYVILLMDCNRHGALIFADRLREAAGSFGAETPFALSCGVASVGWGMKAPEDLLAAATGALDAARKAGGDRIELYEGDQPD